ncbi:Leucine-rich repeat,Leucine-rich repeat domain, L domain-like [Cinara cedri]|uniref:Leucine-rich repeat,Leucine-rich repeat domain, L domain-like n=1 Tax=Cinara cedri TaxID=506608 RepID=A0A5E4M8J5_9HEMI|nr:Leucine-rich repeat,Leucine-rich repeat domain, L domain-like [Cinara cedri]
MEKRIELEKRGRKPEEIDQLILDDCRSTAIVGLTDEYTGLRSLSLINVGLTSLKGFPKLPLLSYLDVSENRISNSLQNLSGCIQIKTLNLGQNKLKDFEAIEPLKSLENLKSLDLSNNEVTKQQGYKEFVLQKFTKTLKYLDGETIANGKTESDSDSDDDDGSECEAEEECDGEEDDDDDNDNENDSEEYDSDNEVYDTSGDVGLEEMLKDNIDEESEGNDYVVDEEEIDQDTSDESDDGDDNDDAGEADGSTANESQDTRGKKRKLNDE